MFKTTAKTNCYCLKHCVKSVHIRSFSGPYFPAFGLNWRDTEYLSVLVQNAGKYRLEKLRINTDTFHAVKKATSRK